jgi:predicted metal-binding protein
MNNRKKTSEVLITFALQAGATKAAILPAGKVRVEDRLASFCHEPKCPYRGLSTNCPPHVSGPTGFRELLAACRQVLVIRLEVESSSLHGEERPFVLRLLHETVARTEQRAMELGFSKASGFAGGSCKPSFCADKKTCRAIEKGRCRFPDLARPSLSGYGVNVGKLMEAAGWSTVLFSSEQDDQNRLAWIAGLILLS